MILLWPVLAMCFCFGQPANVILFGPACAGWSFFALLPVWTTWSCLGQFGLHYSTCASLSNVILIGPDWWQSVNVLGPDWWQICDYAWARLVANLWLCLVQIGGKFVIMLWPDWLQICDYAWSRLVANLWLCLVQSGGKFVWLCLGQIGGKFVFMLGASSKQICDYAVAKLIANPWFC